MAKRMIWLMLGMAVGAAYASETKGAAKVLEHVTVYREDGRFAGWPANHGIWSWGNEILVGFGRGFYKDLGPKRHAIDRERPEEHLLARSLDGGKSWTIEDPAVEGNLVPREGGGLHGTVPPHVDPKTPVDSPGGLDFTDPNLILTFRMVSLHDAPAVMYYSKNRGKNWSVPFRFPLFKQRGVAARTNYFVDGKQTCLAFLTAAKQDGKEGRPFCARTTDGAKTWEFVSFIGPEPKGFGIMPAAVRLSDSEIIVAVRRREEEQRWIEVYRSPDNGSSWELWSTPAPDLGEGNPPSMIRLRDGRVCLTYGYRDVPFGIRAQLSEDGGKTWGAPIVLRDDGAGRDVGYPRTVQRADGNIVTVYYFTDRIDPYGHIAATIWSPGEAGR